MGVETRLLRGSCRHAASPAGEGRLVGCPGECLARTGRFLPASVLPVVGAPGSRYRSQQPAGRGSAERARQTGRRATMGVTARREDSRAGRAAHREEWDAEGLRMVDVVIVEGFGSCPSKRPSRLRVAGSSFASRSNRNSAATSTHGNAAARLPLHRRDPSTILLHCCTVAAACLLAATAAIVAAGAASRRGQAK
jgi:hypothetical protein